MNAPTTTCELVWVRPICRPFPGRPEQIPHVRDFVTRHLQRYGCPNEALYNIVLCADEIATNAIRHTASGRPGAQFFVTVRYADHTIRIEVADDGPAASPIPGTDNKHEDKHEDEYEDTGGRGHLLVEALTQRWGYEATPYGGLAWFEYTFTPNAHSGPEPCPHVPYGVRGSVDAKS